MLPVSLIQSDAHLSTELSLTHQAAKPGAGQKLPARRAAGGGVEFLVPRVGIHEVVCFELS